MTTETDTTPANEADAQRAGNEVLAAVMPALAAYGEADPGSPDQLPDGYLLVVALRLSDETENCGHCPEPHRVTELAVLNQTSPENALQALSTAMRKIGEENGIKVSFANPQQLMAMAMGMDPRRMGRPDDDDDEPAPNTGQYL